MHRSLWLLCALAILLAGCGASSHGQQTTSGPGAAATGRKGRAPDFRISVYQGGDVLGGKRTVRFSEVFRNRRPVVLNFWGATCPPCKAEMPAFESLSKEYAGRVIFVGVDVGPLTGYGSHLDARTLLRQLHITYPAAYAVDSAPLKVFDVVALPTTVFLSRDGRVVEVHSGSISRQQLEAGVRQLLGKLG